MASTTTPTTTPLWTPSPERVAASNLVDFARRNGLTGLDFGALHEWSVTQLDTFWQEVWEYCDIVGDPGDEVLERREDLAACRFFRHGTLNIAENLLARLPASRSAVVCYDESALVCEVTADELREQVAAFASVLRSAGIEPGDRVVAMLPNGLEVLVAMLGAAAVGAVFATASPDFGVTAVLDRFGQIEPVAFVACTAYRYGGKQFDIADKVAAIASGLPSARLRLGVGDAEVDGFDAWSARLAEHRGGQLPFERFPFDHPWYVLFSSGTTGKPKCMVHRAGGVLLKHAMEHRLHCDIKPGDVVTYYTTTGWMMWNWLVSVLSTGATLVLYDGSPAHPTPLRLFEIAEREGITLFGTSARFIDSLASDSVDVAGTYDLSALRTICSTGSPLSPRGFEYVYNSIATDVHLASISGGTDLCGCFLGGVPTLPVFAGELQAPMLGMAVEFVDEDGEPLGAGDGPGELVCAQPFPSQPLGFWGDEPFGPEGSKYQSAYYERFPGKWAHGDFASWTEHGGAVIHGRSDATLNPGGVRIGTGDLYRVVDAMPEVAESIAFGHTVDNDVRIVLAVHLADGCVLDDDIAGAIKARIRAELSPRHVPALIIAVDDLPRTFSGKLVELAVADAVNGRAVRNRDSIANPDALDAIVAHPALRP